MKEGGSNVEEMNPTEFERTAKAQESILFHHSDASASQ